MSVLYIVDPHRLVFTNGHYYLYCCLDGYPNSSFYRIDRMKDITVLETRSADRAPDNSGTEDAVYAFSGKPEQIVMYCDRCILDDVLDHFGTGVRLRAREDGRLDVRLTAPPRGMRFWALQYLPYAEIVEPLWLRDEIRKDLHDNPYTEQGRDGHGGL